MAAAGADLEYISGHLPMATSAKGMGVYLSPSFRQTAWFHFPVTSSVTASNYFRLRELRYQQYLSSPYYVLQVSGNEAALYNGEAGKLVIANEDKYPMHFHDDYEYSPPAHLSAHAGYAGVKSFEKDPAALHNTRLQQFFRQVDRDLQLSAHTPLIVAGSLKSVSLFNQVTAHRSAIAGKVFECFDRSPLQDLEVASWNALQRYREEKEQHAILDLVQYKWRGLATEGLQNVWEAAKAKRIAHLVIEKDYETSATEDGSCSLHIKVQKDGRYIPAVVETIIRSLPQQTKITFVSGQLERHGRIAAILGSAAK
ncbi:hypothetical protein MKQ70_19910 [Chitinophaga sedimenti]|uniref:baeRF3 domain-containing protein n=1 Tax=Chitinophaga sedimenti TaxID=2033606 RepID=UPI0020045232|nr:hypothetical protein [Chitinophaga sedimenti]MCK7557147.1 hypothetical protein [Chitinophaga sedimenti]